MKEQENNQKKEQSRRNFLAQAGLAAGALSPGSLNAFAATTSNTNKTPISNGKVVLVTGFSRDIGAAIAKQLAADGFSVIVNCLKNRDLAANVVDAIKKQEAKLVGYRPM